MYTLKVLALVDAQTPHDRSILVHARSCFDLLPVVSLRLV